MPEKKDISEKVMREIEAKEVKMRSRLYFVVGSVLTAVGLAGTAILSSFLMNVVIFRVTAHRTLNYLFLGRGGVVPFVCVFPWEVLAGFVILLMVGMGLIRKYDFAYKNKQWMVAVGGVVFLLAMALMMQLTSLNRRMAERGLIKEIYRGREIELTPPPYPFRGPGLRRPGLHR
jgi:hypothetical protein